MDLDAGAWQKALGIAAGAAPVALILEGTWWEAKARRTRLAKLDEVEETRFPEMYTGRWQGHRVAYVTAYGAARAVEAAHVFGILGTPLMIQIGTCGGLQMAAEPGMVMVPDSFAPREAVAQHYDPADEIAADPAWADRARALLTAEGARVMRGRHLTWTSLFAQTDAMCRAWGDEGLRSVDMESATVAAVARHFGRSAVALLSVWDALPRGRTFLDPLPPDESAALARSDALVFDVALSLAAEQGDRAGPAGGP